MSKTETHLLVALLLMLTLPACQSFQGLLRNKSDQNINIGKGSKNGWIQSRWKLSSPNPVQDFRHYRHPLNVQSPKNEHWIKNTELSAPTKHQTLSVGQNSKGKNYIREILEQLPEECGEFNRLTLEAILKRPEQGGYAYRGSRAQANNIPIYAGDRKIYTPKSLHGPSYCGGETYGVLFDAFNSMRENPLSQLSEAQLKQLKPIHGADGKNYATGFYGLWNDNYHGARSSIVHFGIGKTVDNLEALCPGDFIKFSRKKYGHSVIFLGFKNEGKEFCYWASSLPTQGRSVRCEKVSDVLQWNIARVTNPENIINIPNYSGANIHAQADRSLSNEREEETYIEDPVYVDSRKASELGQESHI